jgi:hypothetical protein
MHFLLVVGETLKIVNLKQCTFTARFERQYLNKTASISKQELFCVEKYFQKV